MAAARHEPETLLPLLISASDVDNLLKLTDALALVEEMFRYTDSSKAAN